MHHLSRNLFLSALLALLCSGPIMAQTACDNLSAIAETPDVDYESQIQSIWNNRCAGCHTNGGANGGLRLDTGTSIANLVGAAANGSGLNRVEAGDADSSFLFHKLNCGSPGGGNRMPNGGPFLSTDQQALVRDWINQGATAGVPQNAAPAATIDTVSSAFGFEVEISPLDNDTDPDGDVLSLESILQPINGTAVQTGDMVRYTPDIGFSGLDSISYTVVDGNGGSTISRIDINVDPALFLMNFGLSGSWFNSSTDGQGFIIEVIPDQNLVLVYWFTFAADGSGDQQWLIGFGEIFGNTADIEFFRPVGGIFDDPTEVTSPSYATGRIIFTECLNGYFYYDSDVDMVSGEFAFTRITPDPQCQMEIDAADTF